MMRKTLTLDEDVAAALERLRKARNESLKDLVNEALRRGLKEMGGRRKKRIPFQTRAIDPGPPLLTNIDNIAEVLATTEHKAYK